jgi:ankyrin repeat protein
MSTPRDLPARPSLESLRKQAKRLAREAAAGDGEAVTRIHAQLPRAQLPLSNRDAQLIIAREYGFVGWSALVAEVQNRVGQGLEFAASRAKVAIHNENHDQLRALLSEFPALVAWRDENDQTLLDSTTSYAMDCFDPERERTYTRPAAAELLIDAGATVEQKTWMHVIRTGSSGMLRLLGRKNALPQTLPVLAALGDDAAVRSLLQGSNEGDDTAGNNDCAAIGRAFLIACRFKHKDIATHLLDRMIALDPELGGRIDRWQNREAFVQFLMEQPGILWQETETSVWETFVICQLAAARDRNDLPAFRRWLEGEPWILDGACLSAQVELIVPACYKKDREAFISTLLERDPAILHASPPPQPRGSLFAQALSYGNAHLVPLLTRVWPLPNDLPHAAGIGDAAAVARWFDATGKPVLGALSQHYPHNDPHFPRADLHWGSPTAQQVLDIALAWAVLNGHYEIATFLLERGANINTDWATHEPASILHEAAIQGNQEAVRFLIDQGADLTMKDYRYRSNAEGWARYGSGDEKMANLLAAAAAERTRRNAQ